MRSIFIIWLLVIITTSHTYSQIPPMLQVLNTTGASITTGSSGKIVEYSVGELATLTVNPQDDVSITQGILQPFYGFVKTTEAFDEKYTFKCYPNPSTDFLNIETDFKDFDEYQILKISGELVASAHFDYSPIRLGKLPLGVYVLNLVSKNQVIAKSINIIKQ